MVGFGGAFSFREWLRLWTERLNRLEVYLRTQAENDPENDRPQGPDPNDHWHRRN